MKSVAKELVGQVFGRLTVVERAANKGDKARWLCKCVCGGETNVSTAGLTTGKTRSCGCLRRESIAGVNASHGMSGTTEYATWAHIKYRCYSPKDKQYHDYGGRGIKVCERWRDSFEAFFADMGLKPSPELEIDRKDNDKHYSCGKHDECDECARNGWEPNCHWATKEQNCNNKRDNVLVAAFGETKTAAEWDKDPRCVVSARTLRLRINRDGWEGERAIMTPAKECDPLAPVEAFGETKTVGEWAKDDRCVVTYTLLSYRMTSGVWEPEAAITTPAKEQRKDVTFTAFGETKALKEWAKDPRCQVDYRTLHKRAILRGWNPEEAISCPRMPGGAKRVK